MDGPGWLGFVVRGLAVDELKQIFFACLPYFLKEREDFERKATLAEFEEAITGYKSSF